MSNPEHSLAHDITRLSARASRLCLSRSGRLTPIAVVAFAAVALASGCSFDRPTLSGEPDARPDGSLPDGTTRCGWRYIPVHFDPCAIPEPAGVDAAFSVAGTYVYNTDDAVLFVPGGGQDSFPSVVLAQPDGPEVRVISVESFALGAGRALRVIGSRPLLVASRAGIDIAGTLDVSSSASGESGAGANPTPCVDSGAGERGASENDGGGGGGGGGFGSVGGSGGTNGVGNAPGGQGGTVAPTPAAVRGGCPGGDGGAGDLPDTVRGGGGGGAVQLTALEAVSVSGSIAAGGAGGTGADGVTARRGGGGGGGSGGYIGLQAPTVTITAGAVVAANGGGGGGGTNNAVAQDGSDGIAGVEAASGGPGETGANGGDGGALGVEDGLPGGIGQRGGGGGGGGVGYILMFTASATIDSSAVISPRER